MHVHGKIYLAELFLKREKFQTKVVEKIKNKILCPVTFSQKLCLIWDNMEELQGENN
jgi:hypothetical protein